MMLDDIWVEILMRVQPSCISKQIMVSKQWLHTITSLLFRENYLKRWNRLGFAFLGFLVDNPMDKNTESVQLWPTCDLGHDLNQSNFLSGVGNFIAASRNDFILCGNSNKGEYYVCNHVTKQLVLLPDPPASSLSSYRGPYAIMAAGRDDADDVKVLNCSSSSRQHMMDFKVIIARETEWFGFDTPTTLFIDTYSSRKGEWNQSTVRVSSFGVILYFTTAVVIKDIVYWSARNYFSEDFVLAYDTAKSSDDNGCVTLIRIPYFCTQYKLDASAENRLQFFDWGRCHWFILVWVLNDCEVEDGQFNNSRWDFLHRVDFNSITIKNFATLAAMPGSTTGFEFKFAAINPESPDSIFLRWGGHFFLYDFRSEKLERVKYSWSGKRHIEDIDMDSVELRPFTTEYAWPSCPSSLQFKTCLYKY